MHGPRVDGQTHDIQTLQLSWAVGVYVNIDT